MPPWGSLGFATLGAPARSLADPGDEKDSGVEALVKWGSQTIDEFLGWGTQISGGYSTACSGESPGEGADCPGKNAHGTEHGSSPPRAL